MIGFPLVSGTLKNTKANPRSEKPAKRKKAITLPVSVFMIDKNTELTMKLLNQLVAVLIEVAIPIKWMGYISVLTLQTGEDIPIEKKAKYRIKPVMLKYLPAF